MPKWCGFGARGSAPKIEVWHTCALPRRNDTEFLFSLFRCHATPRLAAWYQFVSSLSAICSIAADGWRGRLESCRPWTVIWGLAMSMHVYGDAVGDARRCKRRTRSVLITMFNLSILSMAKVMTLFRFKPCVPKSYISMWRLTVGVALPSLIIWLLCSAFLRLLAAGLIRSL